MGRGHGKAETRGQEHGERGGGGDPEQEGVIGRDRVGHQALAAESLDQAPGGDHRGEGAGQRRQGRPGQGVAIAERAAAMQGGDALEVVVGAVGEGHEQHREGDEQDHGGRPS